MIGKLVPMTHADLASVIELKRPVLLVGRHPECDVRLDSIKVSRRHCCLALINRRLMIRDLGSRNGVRVNGAKVEESPLFPGDEVAIAEIIFRLEDEGDEVTPDRHKARSWNGDPGTHRSASSPGNLADDETAALHAELTPLDD